MTFTVPEHPGTSFPRGGRPVRQRLRAGNDVHRFLVPCDAPLDVLVQAGGGLNMLGASLTGA